MTLIEGTTTAATGIPRFIQHRHSLALPHHTPRPTRPAKPQRASSRGREKRFSKRIDPTDLIICAENSEDVVEVHVGLHARRNAIADREREPYATRDRYVDWLAGGRARLQHWLHNTGLPGPSEALL